MVVGFRDMLEVKESSRSSEMPLKLSSGTGLEAFLAGRLGTWRKRLAVRVGKREGIALGRRWNGWSLFGCLVGSCSHPISVKVDACERLDVSVNPDYNSQIHLPMN